MLGLPPNPQVIPLPDAPVPQAPSDIPILQDHSPPVTRDGLVGPMFDIGSYPAA